MMQVKNIENFYVAGINYRKTEAAVRSSFAINQQQYKQILQAAAAGLQNEFFIISTCNRTEIFGFAQHPDHLIKQLCSQTVGNMDGFKKIAYIKNGGEAIEHLFNVASGLDSQILGDYEIVGQLKLAVQQAKQQACIGAFLERLVNTALQASKSIKNKTQLSAGTVSVAFAAVQYLKNTIAGIADKNILLLGTGKIGRSTCKNMVDYLGTTNITLVNRTIEKAEKLAKELSLIAKPITALETQITSADIILVATAAAQPTILQKHLLHAGEKIIIDLSIPCNVEQAAQQLANVTFINVDAISKMKDETLANRNAAIPEAQKIIAQHINDFFEWYEMRTHVPVIKAVTNRLRTMPNCNFYKNSLALHSAKHAAPAHTEERIQQVIGKMAVKMRNQNLKGCHYLEAINDYIAVGSN